MLEFHEPSINVETALRRLAPRLPGSIRYRVLNSLEHFERSFALYELDREIASFRAITGEEEAATALIKSIQLRRYPHARSFNARDHVHKMAVLSCVMAITEDVSPLLREFQLIFNFEECRIDLKIPLSNFDVSGGKDYAIQLVEPLDLIARVDGLSDPRPFGEALNKLAARSNFENIKKLVSAQSNARNTLLYASDCALPQSRASLDILQNRKKRTLILLVLTVMILQSRKHLGLVRQATLSFLSVVSKLPPEEQMSND